MHKIIILILITVFMGCTEAPPSKDAATPRLIDPPEQIDEPIPPKNNQVMCTQDAMQCPDGTGVGRSGPNCEFICPNGDASK